MSLLNCKLEQKQDDHYTTIKIVETQNLDNSKSKQGCGAMGTMLHCRQGCRVVWLTWKVAPWFLTKLNILLPCDPAITPLGTDSKEVKTEPHKSCTRMMTVAVFIMVKP